MARSADDLANKLVAGGRAITRANREGVGDAVKAGVVVAEGAVRAASGDGRLSGMRGARVGAFGKVMGYMNPVGIVAYRGPVHILNNPTKAHAIYPRRAQVRDSSGTVTRRRRRGGASGLRFPDGGIRLGVNHPGTKGKQFHERQVEPVVLRQSPRIIQASIRSHLARTFSGL